MKEYHKIQSVFKRDEKTKRFVIDDFSTPELGYLAGLRWQWDEKVDGTNIRIHWDGVNRTFGGRTANALIPATLFPRLEGLFTPEKLKTVFPDGTATLYGEGFGAKIQNGGEYRTNGCADFILFDVLVGSFWLKREDVVDVSLKLGLLVTPIIDTGTILDAIEFVKLGFPSQLGKRQAEGLVLRPHIQLFDRRGDRIITKIKTKDFK